MSKQKATFQVHLRAIHESFIQVEAYSEQKAIELALDEDCNHSTWYFDEGDVQGIEVIPASEADISALVEVLK